MTHPPEREIGTELTDALHQSTGSYELVIAAIAAAGLGFWIDNVLGIIPVFTLIFALAGFIGAGYSLYLKYQAQMAEASKARTSRDHTPTTTSTATTSTAIAAPATPVTAASKARARDERISGAKRSAPTGDAVLRANGAFAAKQEGNSYTERPVARVAGSDEGREFAAQQELKSSTVGAERSAPTDDAVLRANAAHAAQQGLSSSGSPATAASKARARDERVSGAERSAPTEASVLRANAAHAAQQVSKS